MYRQNHIDFRNVFFQMCIVQIYSENWRFSMISYIHDSQCVLLWLGILFAHYFCEFLIKSAIYLNVSELFESRTVQLPKSSAAFVARPQSEEQQQHRTPHTTSLPTVHSCEGVSRAQGDTSHTERARERKERSWKLNSYSQLNALGIKMAACVLLIKIWTMHLAAKKNHRKGVRKSASHINNPVSPAVSENSTVSKMEWEMLNLSDWCVF